MDKMASASISTSYSVAHTTARAQTSPLRPARHVLAATCGCAYPRSPALLRPSGGVVASRHQPQRCSAVAASLEVLERAEQSGASTSERLEPETQQFDWLSQWYPVACVDYLDPTKPTAVTLLGKHLALWQDAGGTWRCVEDRCPHRLAALSEGRVRNGNIACGYHGWEFDGHGQCVGIPQALNLEAEQKACSNPSSRAAAHPTQVRQGLVWVWAKGGPEAFIHAAAKAPNLAPEMEEEGWADIGGFVMNDNPVSWEIMMENALDPVHANFVHDDLIDSWDNAVPMPMKRSTPIDAHTGFLVTHGPYSKKQQGLQGERQFLPPVTMRSHYTYEGSNREAAFAVYFTPISPGITRTFFGARFRPAPPASLLSAAQKLLPRWAVGIAHVRSQRLADQDNVCLHAQDHIIAGAGADYTDFYMAAPSDTGVASLRRWLAGMAGGEVPYEGSRQLPAQSSREELHNIYTRHTQHCSYCQEAHSVVGRAHKAAGAVAWALLLGALWLSSVGGGSRLLGVPQAVLVGAAAGLTFFARSKLEALQEDFHFPRKLR